MAPADLLTLTIAQAAPKLERRELSPVELTEAMLARIATVNKQLNAYITVCDQQAREAAQAVERLIRAGYYLGPLHGIPIALKDNIYTHGVRTTAGAKILADFVPDEDATVTARLKRAGAIIVGKTNMHEFAWGGTTDNPHYGTCRNPWNPERFPAGSSGGSGAAVAARTCLGALGTDTGGSIRLPSAVNGIVGIRPTIGRVSNYNVVPLAWTMDTVSPMTRTVEDCLTMFEVVAGHDPLDAHSAQVPVADYRAELGRGMRGLRIGLIRDYSLTHVQKAVGDAVRSALKAMERLGAQVEEIAMPSIHGNISAQLTIESCEPSTYHQEWLRARPQDYGEDVRTLLEMGEMYLATHYLQAQRYRSVLRKEFLAGFKQVDVFVTPTLPFTATPCGATEVVIENDRKEDMLSAIMQFTGVPSLAGLPALSLPVGFDPDGMPVGMQIIGRPFDEGTLFRIGHTYQGETDWHTRAPKL
ncbi:MAG: Asp-tRNA(Asn)/Glu-tRNA(Gln) amidotransferase subunit GatA [Candidatus Rokubacteria bacterium]|nr:Asp-tRNA(Asn)/Glu-tRNA(Gln) amidotransferase subunit GatA [Candidatus Rokubacteria bacterium]